MPIKAKGVVQNQQDPRIKTIDLDRLKEDRNSIWAAAYQAYLAGESWQFTSYELSQIEQCMEGFSSDSSIEQRVEQELGRLRTGIYQGRSYITLTDLFRALQVDISQQQQLQRAVTDCLKKRGWALERVRMGGPMVRAWFAPGQLGTASELE
jgi:predicted P-loop ATPase